MTTYYTPRAGSINLYALVLLKKAQELKQSEGFMRHQDLYDHMKEEYGDDVKCVRYTELQRILNSRLVHSQEMQDLLKNYGEEIGVSLASCFVYGSYNRPIGGMWASIEGAVYIESDKWETGYYTYVAVPDELDKETLDRYELHFVSRA